MTEVCAAMGLTNLEELSSVIETNGGHYRAYRDALATLPGVEMVEYDERDRGNFQYVIIEIGEKFPLTRDELMTVLHADGVLARRYFHPGCHAMQPYALEMPDAAASLPHTDALCRRVLSLPTGSAVSAENVAAVCAIIRLAAQHGEEVRRQLEDGGEGSHG
jgi:dTDP-4-amino-4,6-dideoxygalactose transaminase